MSHLLIVEDETSISDPLVRFLEREGHTVVVAENAARARAAMNDTIDLVILDWMLPDTPGIDLLSEWRKTGRDIPIIFVTARTDLIDKVLGLELGADDYMTKPFEARELLARIKARLRSAPVQSALLSAAGVTINAATRAVTFRGVPLELTKMEHALLKLLVQSPGQVFTRDELLERVWGYDRYPTTRTVDTHVLQIRQKTSAELIETVRGVGYRLRADDN